MFENFQKIMTIRINFNITKSLRKGYIGCTYLLLSWWLNFLFRLFHILWFDHRGNWNFLGLSAAFSNSRPLRRITTLHCSNWFFRGSSVSDGKFPSGCRCNWDADCPIWISMFLIEALFSCRLACAASMNFFIITSRSGFWGAGGGWLSLRPCWKLRILQLLAYEKFGWFFNPDCMYLRKRSFCGFCCGCWHNSPPHGQVYIDN